MALDILLFLLLITGCASCNSDAPSDDIQPVPALLYDTIPQSHTVVPMIKETSGIADSRLNKGYLWAQEDSGNPTQLHLLDYKGKVAKKVHLKGVVNRDWEDLALSGKDLFLADFGDNKQIYPSYTIYQFPEPAATVDTVSEIKSIRFKYPDKSHDAEAFLIDHTSKDIYILSKRDTVAMVFQLKAPYSYTDTNTLKHVATLTYNGIVSAAQSADGKEVIVKTYTTLYYYNRKTGESLTEVLKKTPQPIGYQLEPQGEAITFALDNSGFFTLSEKGFSNFVNLNFYRRK